MSAADERCGCGKRWIDHQTVGEFATGTTPAPFNDRSNASDDEFARAVARFHEEDT